MFKNIAIFIYLVCITCLSNTAQATTYFYTGEAKAHINYYWPYLVGHETATTGLLGGVFAEYNDHTSLLSMQILFTDIGQEGNCPADVDFDCGLPSNISGMPFLLTMEKIISPIGNNMGSFDPYNFIYPNGSIDAGNTLNNEISFFNVFPPELTFDARPNNYFPSTFNHGIFNLGFDTGDGSGNIIELLVEGSFTSCHAEVPEPASLFLTGIGLFGIGKLRRKRNLIKN